MKTKPPSLFSLFSLAFALPWVVFISSCCGDDASPSPSKSSYTLRFETNGGSFFAPRDIPLGGKIAEPDSLPEKQGYLFAGWYADKKLTTEFNFDRVILRDTTIYAKWEIVWNAPPAAIYTLRFETNGGSAMSSRQIPSGARGVEPDTLPQKAGYIFSGWYADRKLSKPFSFESAILRDTTVYAKWDIRAANTHTFRFHTSGGSYAGFQQIPFGGKAKRPADPRKANFTFAGWYTDRTLSKAFDFAGVILRDSVVYAKWRPIVLYSYELRFDMRGGAPIASQQVPAGEQASSPSTVLERIGFSFAGWFADSTFTSAFSFSGHILKDTTVYAKWNKKNQYVLRFDLKGGSPAIDSQRIYEGDKSLAPSDPTKKNVRFGGWFADTACTTAFDFKGAIDKDTTLYAQWIPIFHLLRFDVNGGSAIDSQRVRAGEKAVAPADPTKTHFTFEDWYADAALTAVFDFNAIIDKDTTLYAKWTHIVYALTFDENGGSPAIDSQRINGGDKARAPVPPTKTDFTFGGWYGDHALTTSFDFNGAIDKDTLLYAKWNPIYTLRFELNGGAPAGASQRINAGDKANAPAAHPTKTRFTFGGWYGDTALSVAFDFNGAIDRDTVLYAKWEDKIIAAVIQDRIISPEIIRDVLSDYPPNDSLRIIHLRPGGTGDGSRWSRAAGNLKTAIDGIDDAAPNRVYLIVMAVGEYAAGNTIVMKNNVAVTGGFVGTTDDDYAAAAGDTTILTGEDSYRVAESKGVDSSALLYRLHIAHGYINAGNLGRVGVGLYNEHSSPKIVHVVFHHNFSSYDGGAMANLDHSSPILTNVTFSHNSARDGGGMLNIQSSPTLTNVLFDHNASAGYGGAMSNDGVVCFPILTNVTFSYNTAKNGGAMHGIRGSSAKLTDVRFSYNTAENKGGGMYNWNSYPALENVRFEHNAAPHGGGMLNEQNSSPTLTNVLFEYNTASQDGGGMGNSNYSSPTLTDARFAHNTAGSIGGGMDNSNYSSPTLTNVRFDSNTAFIGGGMGNSIESSPTLTNVDFSYNSAKIAGGMENFNFSNSSLSNVRFSYNTAESGGGMRNSAANPSLSNVRFSYNTAENGGGMENTKADPILTDVIFSYNTASKQGGGMYNEQISSPRLKNVLFDHNSAEEGGGMFNGSHNYRTIASSPILTNVNFFYNSASNNGGGMYNSQLSYPILTNVNIAYNSAMYGGGIFNKGGVTNGGVNNNDSTLPILCNSIVAYNDASSAGGGIYSVNSSSPLIVNGIIWGNTVGKGPARTVVNTRPYDISVIAGSSTPRSQVDLESAAGIRMYNSVLEGGKADINGSGSIVYVDMQDAGDPYVNTTIRANSSLLDLASSPIGNAVNIGLYAKRNGKELYFSTDNISWFTIDENGNKTPAAVPPANAEDLTATDSRGYRRVGKPDAGSYEAAATP